MADLAFMLDSNICIYATKGLSERLRARLAMQSEGSLAVSSISLAEVELGYGRAAEDRRALDALLEEVEVVPFNTAAARIYATLPFRRSGFDRLIAGHALSLGLTLVTNDQRGFADVPGLRVENWTA